MTQQNSIREEQIGEMAANWHVASAGDAMDWDGFTLWLEADPRHHAAYDQIARADALLDWHREALRGIGDGAGAARARWRRGLSAIPAIAALAIAAIALPVLLRQFHDTADTTYATASAARTIALADGSTIALAPHSRLVLHGPRGEAMRLTGGAYFTIRHDPARALAISAGPLTIRDIGTRFDVQADGEVVRLGIAEGWVQVASGELAAPIALGRGRALLFDGTAGRAELRTVDVGSLGGWRQGRLSYDDTPLALVSADLARYAGIQLGVPPQLRGRRFSGTLVVSDARKTTRDLAQVLGLVVVRGAGGDHLAVPARR